MVAQGPVGCRGGRRGGREGRTKSKATWRVDGGKERTDGGWEARRWLEFKTGCWDKPRC